MNEADEKGGADNSSSGTPAAGEDGELRQAVRLLVEMETVFAALPEPLFTCDLRGRIVRANPAMQAACGFDPADADHAQVLQGLEVRHSDGRPMEAEDLPSSRAARGERVREERILFRPAGGWERIALCSASPLEIGGEIFGAVVLLRDVTGYEGLLDEMARRMAELDAIINAIADAVVIYGSRGEILRMNPAARQILGYPPEDFVRPIGERTAALGLKTAEGEPFPVEEVMRRVLHGGETVKGMILCLDRPAGEKLWVSASAAPIVTADGRRIGAVGTAADISRLRELQEEREVYLHTISHDLRSPLTIIQGHAQLLEAAIAGGREELRESVEAILQGAKGMADMIDALVDTAFLESGQMRLKPEPVDLRSFIEDYLRRAETALDRERITVDFPPGLPVVMADPLRLERIFSNLLTNALKYSPPGSPVRLEARGNGTSVCVSVIDRGPGIAAEDLPHIFERFYRTKRERKGKGIGLGLYITRLLAEAHGGRIWVRSKPGQGSSFCFSLPMADQS